MHDPLATLFVERGLLTAEEARTDGDVRQLARSGFVPAPLLRQIEAGLPLRLGRYSVIGRLGVGGMGLVLRGRDEALGRDVALKVLSPGASQAMVQRLRQEAKAMARLRHPNVVAVYGLEEEEGILLLVMELVDGLSLDKRLLETGPLGEPEAWRLLEDTASALAHAEERGLFHRDIKPGNVMWEPRDRGSGEGVYRLCDFGLARSLERHEESLSLTRSGMMIGTPLYASPEQLCAVRDLDARSDMYSLGLMMMEAMTGHVPGEAAGTQADLIASRLRGEVPDVRQLRRDVSPALATLLRDLTALEREKRPASWQIVLRWLAHHQDRSKPGTQGRPALEGRAAQPRRLVERGTKREPKSRVRPKRSPTIRELKLRLTIAAVGFASLVTVMSLSRSSQPLRNSDPIEHSTGETISQEPSKLALRALSIACSNNLRKLALGALCYQDAKRVYPWVAVDPSGRAAFDLLFKSGHLDGGPELWACPARSRAAGSYEGFTLPYGPDTPNDTPLLWDSQPHPDGKRNVAFADGTVTSVDEEGWVKVRERVAGLFAAWHQKTQTSGNEQAAIAALRTIASAQVLFRESGRSGRFEYGNLRELSDATLVDQVLGSGTKQGYVFDVRVGTEAPEFCWFATAVPQKPGLTGARYFATNQRGAVFFSLDRPIPMNDRDCKMPPWALPLEGKSGGSARDAHGSNQGPR